MLIEQSWPGVYQDPLYSKEDRLNSMAIKWTISKAGPLIILVPLVFQAIFLLFLWLLLDEASARIEHFNSPAVHASADDLEANAGLLLRQQKLKVLIVAGLLLTLLLSLSLGVYFFLGITRRLSVINDNAVRLSKREPLNLPVEGNDEISQLDSVFHKMADVLEQASRREHAMIENAKDVIATLDKQGKFIGANPAACVLLGYDPDRLVGRSLNELVLAEDVESTETALAKMPQSFRQTIEHRLRGHDGNVHDIRWSMQWDEQEETVFCIGHDISERKQFERLKQDIVNMVSHDLRSPLTAIRMTVELVLMEALGPITDQAKKRLETVDKDTDRLIRLVNELLDYEKIQAGKLRLSRESKASGSWSRTL
jgi:PAS domain S-box-containing protein